MNKSTPKDVFAHLLAVVMLIVSVVSFTTIVFQFVNVYFPDELEFYASRQAIGSAVQGAIAALVIAWPVYLYMLYVLGRDVETDPEKREIKVRKWLFNFTLFIAAITIIVDLITLIRSFLGGELSGRVGLKIIAVLVVAGLVLGYYVWDLRRDFLVPDKLSRPLAAGLSLVVVGSVVAGFFLAGTPEVQRRWRLDGQRVNDLQILQGQIIQYWNVKDALPSNLAELNNEVLGFEVPVDPKTGEPYEYEVTGDLAFRLCATFAEESVERSESEAYRRRMSETWDHGSGRVCFDRTIDPVLNRDPALKREPLLVPLQ